MKFGKSKADIPGSSNSALYENTNILTVNTTAKTQITNIEEEDYETIDETIEPIEVRDSHERKQKIASNDTIQPIEVRDSHERKKKIASNDTLKRLECRFNVLTVLITVVNITLITLVIFLFVPKSSVDGHWTQWTSWTSCDVTCGNGKHLRLRTCTNPLASTNDCIGESLQTRECTIGNCTAFLSAFSVTAPHSYSKINGVRKLNFSRTIYQHGNDFNISTGTYTCNKPGVYHFSVTLVTKWTTSSVDLVSCYLYKNRQYLIYIKVDPTNDEPDKGNAAISQSIVINLNVGDTVYLTRCSNPSTSIAFWSTFTGFLLYDNN